MVEQLSARIKDQAK
jgi:hypothetical protein